MPTSSDFTATCNTTIVSWAQCTPQTCCLKQGQIEYLPTLAGNALFVAIFAILILPNIYFGVRYKTWSFFGWMSMGLLAEIVGYTGRIQLHNNIFSFDAFLVYLIPLTIGPAFMTASIYLCLARIVYILDPTLKYSRLKPMTYTKVFVTFDFICLILQGAGGGVAATAGNDKSLGDMGVHIMVAGLAFQVFSLVAFITLCVDFAVRLHRRSGTASKPGNGYTSTEELMESAPNGTVTTAPTKVASAEAEYQQIRRTGKFKGFICGLAAAVGFILIRSAYRLAELQEGFNGKLANDEVTFMILEGPMIILACVALSTFHPGAAMQGLWSMKIFRNRAAQSDSKDNC